MALHKISAGGKILLAIFLLQTSAFSEINGQSGTQKPSRQGALDLFSEGEYEKAYAEFNGLMKIFERDPVYRYYSGVCLVKLNSDPDIAAMLLREAVKSSQVIRPVPDDAWFYLGRSLQMAGNYSEAITSFDEFTSRAGKKVAKKFRTGQFIEECRGNRGQLTSPSTVHAGLLARNAEQGHNIPADAEKESVQVPAENPSRPREKLNENYDKALTEGMNFQVKADSLNGISAGYRKTIGTIPDDQQPVLKQQISQTDSLAAEFQKLADSKLTDATQPQERPAVSVATEGPLQLFDVVSDPSAIARQKIPIDPKVSPGLIYRIQMGVFSREVQASFFKGITPVSAFRIPSSGMIRYFAGVFRKAADANKALLRVKQIGFRDSFIVAVMDGSPVSLERAALLEKEWGQKSLSPDPSVISQARPQETGPPTLSYRVEISRTPKPEKEEVIMTYRKLSGNRGFEILTLEDGTNVHLIGKFITFESAFEYADLLNRNGYREAKVVAWLGNREIDLDTAKQLFEKIE